MTRLSMFDIFCWTEDNIELFFVDSFWLITKCSLKFLISAKRIFVVVVMSERSIAHSDENEWYVSSRVAVNLILSFLELVSEIIEFSEYRRVTASNASSRIVSLIFLLWSSASERIFNCLVRRIISSKRLESSDNLVFSNSFSNMWLKRFFLKILYKCEN